MQSYGRQYRELKNRRNKKGDEQNVDYIGFMQYTDGRCVEESND
jgi:hypothetical protein